MYKQDPKKTDTGRRNVIKAAAALTGAAILGAPAIVGAKEHRIVTRDPGGPFNKGFGKAFYEPFKKATGITVVGVPSQSEPAGMVKAMVEARNYTWDMAHLSKSSHLSLANLGYLEAITPPGGAGPNLSKIPAIMRGEFILGIDVYATLLAYRTDAVKKVPTGWKDYFDVKGFPARRALRKNPFDTLEQALLADGVPASQLYPLDLDRAFRKLDQIKRNVDVWWENGAQSSQLLRTGEVDMMPAWNGRAQVAIDDGAPVKFVWNQSLWTYEGFTILKGGPNVSMCREFIEFCAQPQQQALFTDDIAYGPTAPDAFKYIRPERAKLLPTNPDYFFKMIQVNSEYWGKNQGPVTERFNAWLLS